MIVIRLATIDDAEAIARQTADVQRQHHDALPDIFKPPSLELFSPQKLARLIEDPNAIVAVAEMEGGLVGHIYGAVVKRAENEFHQPGASLYIYQIGVDADARRRGVGTALMRFILDQAPALGATAMHVDHWTFNTRARTFFEACGFAPMKLTMRRTVSAD
jgi:diamine N-acetyltransferase